MELQFITRGTKSIVFKVERPGQIEEETATITAHEAPLESFNEAMNNLRTVIREMLELPEKWVDTVMVKTLSISRTKAGTRSVSIAFARTGKTGRTFTAPTPLFRIDSPENEDEKIDPELSKKSIELVVIMINEAMRYVEGERAQALLPFEKSETEGGEDESEDGQEELPV